MRKITAKKYATSLYEILKTTEKEKIPLVLKTFVALLAKNKQLNQADKIMEAFKRYADEQEGIKEMTILTAQKLDLPQKEEIIKSFHQTLKKEIALKEYVDKSLLGGVVIKYDDKVIDGSIKKRIALLTQNLK